MYTLCDHLDFFPLSQRMSCQPSQVHAHIEHGTLGAAEVSFPDDGAFMHLVR